MIGIDLLEEWLFCNKWERDYLKILTPKEIKKEIKYFLNKQIEELLEQTNQTGPYTELELLYPYRKILDVRIMPQGEFFKDKKGQLCPRKGGFIILINPDYSDPIDKRFTLAHEIGHTFLFDINRDIPTKPYNASQSSYTLQENYADEIARGILIPKKSIETFINEKKLILPTRLANKLSELYGISHNVLGMRLVDDLKLCSCYQLHLDV